MLKRRRRLLLVALVGLALAGGAWTWSVFTTNHWEVASSRISIGMTHNEVRTIMGGPPTLTFYGLVDETDASMWEVVGATITVKFSDKGVVQKTFVKRSLLQSARRFLLRHGYP